MRTPTTRREDFIARPALTRRARWRIIRAASAATAQVNVMSLNIRLPVMERRCFMPHTYTLQLVHCVFSTKRRSGLIADPPRMWTYMRAIARNCGINVTAIGGTANHVHILRTIPPMTRTGDVMRTLKANSSRWMNEIGRGFAWQDGYAAISVSPSQIPAVVRYIEHQAEHHRSRSFEQEYVMLLQKSGVAFDANQLF